MTNQTALSRKQAVATSRIRSSALHLSIVLMLSVRAMAVTETENLAQGKLIHAPEIDALLIPSMKGRLFTLRVLPQFDVMKPSSKLHKFRIPNTTSHCAFTVVLDNTMLEQGTPFMVTDVKQVVKMMQSKSGHWHKVATPMIEMRRLTKEGVSNKDADRILYQASFVVTEREVYDEEIFLTALEMYFDPVAQELRMGRDCSGKAELEGTKEGIQTMINLIGLDWMIGGKNYKGLIEKEKAKDGGSADFYVLKFEAPVPAKNGDKLTPAFPRNDWRHPFHNFNPIVIDGKSVSVGGVFSHFEVRVINPK